MVAVFAISRNHLAIQHPPSEVIAFSCNGFQCHIAVVIEATAGGRHRAALCGRCRHLQGHLTVDELNPCGLLAFRAGEAFVVLDGGCLYGQHVVTIKESHLIELELELRLTHLLNHNLRSILADALAVEGDVVGGEALCLNRFVELHGQVSELLRQHRSLLGHAGVALNLQLQLRLRLEGQAEGLFCGRHVSDEVQTVLIKRILAIAQCAVGLPDIVHIDLCSIGADNLHQPLLAVGRVDQ